MTRKAILPILFAAVHCHQADGQGTATTLLIELQNVVEYQADTTDLSKFGTNPNVTTGGFTTTAGCLSHSIVGLGDIVSVNGQPAKGTYISRAVAVCVSPTPIPGQPIADTSWNSIRYETFEILQSDGTPVGTIMTCGLNNGAPSPPGPPAGTQNLAITGGTGAFFGARGQKGNGNAGLSGVVSTRSASIVEDPANRRQNGGGHIRSVLYLVPMSQPQIATTAGGPAVTHSSDFSLVSASKPAAAGEILSLFATGLGPTLPGVAPGAPFPSSPLAAVNSPVTVTVSGKPAQVLGAAGYPGAVDGYQVNFRVPPDTGAGTATLQINSAWIPGAPVTIAVK